MISEKTPSIASDAGGKPPILRGVRVLDLSRFPVGSAGDPVSRRHGRGSHPDDEPRGGDPTFTAPPFFGPRGVAFDRRTSEDLGIAYLEADTWQEVDQPRPEEARGPRSAAQLVREADVLGNT